MGKEKVATMSYSALFSESCKVWNSPKRRTKLAIIFKFRKFKLIKNLDNSDTNREGNTEKLEWKHENNNYEPHRLLLSPGISSLQKGYSYLHLDGTSLQAAR